MSFTARGSTAFLLTGGNLPSPLDYEGDEESSANAESRYRLTGGADPAHSPPSEAHPTASPVVTLPSPSSALPNGSRQRKPTATITPTFAANTPRFVSNSTRPTTLDSSLEEAAVPEGATPVKNLVDYTRIFSPTSSISLSSPTADSASWHNDNNSEFTKTTTTTVSHATNGDTPLGFRLKPIFSGLSDSSSSPYSPSRTVAPLGDDTKLKNSASASRLQVSNAQRPSLRLNLFHHNNRDEDFSSTTSPRIALPPPLPIADITPVSSTALSPPTTATTASSPKKQRNPVFLDDPQTRTIQDQRGICSRLSSLPTSAGSQSSTSLISQSLSNELLSTPLRARNGSSFPSQRQRKNADAASAAAPSAASIILVREDDDDDVYHYYSHHGDVKDSRRKTNGIYVGSSSPSIDNTKWKDELIKEEGDGGLKDIPCVHRESSSVIDALHSLTSPIETDQKFSRRKRRKENSCVGVDDEENDDRTLGNGKDEIQILTSRRHQRPDSRPNDQPTNAASSRSLFSATPATFADSLGTSSVASPAPAKSRVGGDNHDVFAADAGDLRDRAAPPIELSGVYLKMTSNRYKRTEFEEGDGESIGGSSVDSSTLPSGECASSSRHHDHHGGGFKLFDPYVAFKSPRAWLGCRSPLEKILFVLLFVCVVVIFAISVALNSMRQLGNSSSKNPFPKNLCLTRDCVNFANGILDSIDDSVDPCDDFYQYACGRWIERHPIPIGHSSWGTFGVLHEKNQMIMKNALESQEQDSTHSAAKQKAFDYYSSCMDKNKIKNSLNDEPLRNILSEIGNWNISGNFSLNGTTKNSDGGWDLTKQLIKMHGKFSNSAFFIFYVGVDAKNSTSNILTVDESGLTLSRDFYINDTKPENAKVLKALKKTIVNIAVLLGGDADSAQSQAEDLIMFERRLAEITTPMEQRRDEALLYHKMTLKNLTQFAPFIDWRNYANARLRESALLSRDAQEDGGKDGSGISPLDETEPIVVNSPEYLKNLNDLIEEFLQTDDGKTTINNYMVWHTVFYFSSFLTEEYREAKTPLTQALTGSIGVTEKWRECVNDVTRKLGFASGALFVEETFGQGESTKNDAETMIGHIRESFMQNVKEVEWMDENTRAKALEKANAVVDMIGFPEFILNQDLLDEYYVDLNVSNETYFDNVVSSVQTELRRNLKRLRNPVDRKKWDMPPSEVNAYYEPSKNEMVFPAGILQVPFYNANYPKALNFGGIGVVMGHELTHGFDDQGREYDRFGNLNTWWTNDSLAKFKEHAKCLVDQYSNYTVPSGEHLHGKSNLGENIADNGGLKAAFGAYDKWRNDYRHLVELQPILPGVNLTDYQLFFIGFAQVWCSTSTKQSVHSDLMVDPHSPAKWRVIGTLSNSLDFAEKWNCSKKAKMNPENKCQVW